MEWSISYKPAHRALQPQSVTDSRMPDSPISDSVKSDQFAATGVPDQSDTASDQPAPHNLIAVAVTGTFCVDAHRQLMGDILASPHWQQGRGLLLDFRLTSFKQSDLQTMIAICDTHIEYDEVIGTSPIAILVSDDLAYGSVRQFLLLSTDKISAPFRLSRDPVDAIDWLQSSASVYS